ncbi:cytochrome P450 [Endogone sp. FLAS-F59071]|nr:cytochrome P450 [Endogone sp. FLAS-F59071]|eukprot:RUS19689.1 cytochrome P450 [Endogone sp. FLAS-F59071]
MLSLSSRLIDNDGGMVIPIAAGLLVAFVSYQLFWPAKKTVFDNIPKAPFNVARSFDLLPAIRPDPFAGFMELTKSNDYKPICVFWVAGIIPVIVVNTLELTKEILVALQGTNERDFERSVMITERELHAFLQHWRWAKNILAPAFAPRKMISTVFPYTLKRARALVDEIEEKRASSEAAIDILPLTAAFTLDVICKFLYGRAGEEELDFSDLGGKQNIHKIFTDIVAGFSSDWHKLPIIGRTEWAKRPYRPATERFNRFLTKAINAAFLDAAHGSTTHTFVTGFEQSPEFDPASPEGRIFLRDETGGIVFAGFDTTANSLSFALGLLAERPDIQTEIAREVQEMFGSGPVDVEAIKPESLRDLKMTNAVIRETFRVHPITFGSFVTSKNKVNISGLEIPAGTEFICNFRGIYRDPTLFPEPDKFDPYRWLESETTAKLPDMVFNMGAHSCVGRPLAMLELRLALALLVNRFEMRLKPGFKVETKFGITMMPKHGVWLEFKERSTGHEE